MIRLNAALLEELQLGFLPVPHKNALLRAIYGELELRVGMRIAVMLTPSQLDEFDNLIRQAEQGQALAWIKENAPTYRDVVRDELGSILAELRDSTSEIRSAAIAFPI